jgi:hypothetical protein
VSLLSRRRYWLLPAFVALLALVVDGLVLSGIGGPARHARAPATDQSAPVLLNEGAKHSRPDIADYNTIITERDGLTRDATALLGTISNCERDVTDPYGVGLSGLNQCLSVPIRQNIMRARVEPMMLLGPLRKMKAGRCLQFTSALSGALSELGEASYAWSGDVEDPGSAPGVQERRDVRDLRQIARGIIRLARLPSWAAACRPLRDQPMEDQTHRSRPRSGRPQFAL